MVPRVDRKPGETTPPEDDGSLRDRVRHAVRSGTLPDRPPDRTWGGLGTGAKCAVCRHPVGVKEVELEMEFGGGGEELSNEIHMHHRCFKVWEAERSSNEPLPESG